MIATVNSTADDLTSDFVKGLSFLNVLFMIYLFNGGELLQSIEEYKKEENNYNIHNNLGFISYFNIKYKNNLEKLIEDVKKNKKIDDVSSINII